MDQNDAITLYLNAHHLHEHLATASHADRVEARRHVRAFVAAAKEKRDAALPGLESEVSAARAAMDHARQAYNDSADANNEAVGRLNQVKREFDQCAGVLEMRLGDYPDRQADAALTAEVAAGA